MTTALREPEEVIARGTDVVPDIHVYDDVLPDPEGYRALALAHAFQTFEIGGDQWHGFAACCQTDIVDWLRDVRPDLTATLSFLRHSPQGQQEPNFVGNTSRPGSIASCCFRRGISTHGRCMTTTARVRRPG